jgi:hypothetical protein
MKTMKWLIKREMWENKGMLLWTPVVIACGGDAGPHQPVPRQNERHPGGGP